MVTQIRQIEVLSPVATGTSASHALSASVPTVEGKVCGIVNNNKANAKTFLVEVSDQLTGQHGVKDLFMTDKGSAARPADPGELQRFERVDFAITAFAD